MCLLLYKLKVYKNRKKKYEDTYVACKRRLQEVLIRVSTLCPHNAWQKAHGKKIEMIGSEKVFNDCIKLHSFEAKNWIVR